MQEPPSESGLRIVHVVDERIRAAMGLGDRIPTTS